MKGNLMQPVDPQTPMHATLTAQEWNAVLGALGEAPYRIAAPIIQKLGLQLNQQQTERAGMMMPEPALRPNGEDANATG